MLRLLLIFLITTSCLKSQTIGGENVFHFIKLPNTPQLTALGGLNLSNQTNDVGLVFHNPSLLHPDMHAQLNLVYNSFFAGIRNFQLQSAYYKKNWATTFGLGIHYFHYGSVVQTDVSGNILGNFKPADYLIQVNAARSYSPRITYAGTIKFIQSNYGQYHSSGLALDVSVLYADTSNLLRASLVLKNMGVQLKPFQGSDKDDLPFDIQAGISKRLSKAPLQFSLTVHHLHQFDILYQDTAFMNEFPGRNRIKQSYFFDKLFRHFVFATQLMLNERVEISVGYNHLRRKELNSGNSGNGLNGFSMGFGVLFRKLQIRYARAYYQNTRAYIQFGLSMDLKGL